MKRLYTCPHCRGVLNPNVKIILAARYRKKEGLLLLSPQPGNFQVICDDGFEGAVPEGSTIHFRCPLCAGDLTSPKSKEFAQILATNAGGGLSRVEFSRVQGVHATFVVTEDEVKPYGADAKGYDPINFFGS